MEPKDSISLRTELSRFEFEGNLRSDAACFPDSAMLPDWMRASLKLALLATRKLGWNGLGDRSGWTTYKGWDGEGPVGNGVSLAGLSLDAMSAWIHESPVPVPVDITQESLLSGELAVRIGDFIDKTLWTLYTKALSAPAYWIEWVSFLAWFASVPSPGRILSGWGKWCEDWQGITRDASAWYCSQKGGIRKLQDRSCIANAPEIGLQLGAVWIPGGMKDRRWLLSPNESSKYLEGDLSEAWAAWPEKGIWHGFAPGYSHCGDIDWIPVERLTGGSSKWNVAGGHNGFVFAPLERDDDKLPTAMVAVFFDDMENPDREHDGVFRWGSSPLVHTFNEELFADDGVLRPQRECPWCAINPWDGLLYTSAFTPPYNKDSDVSYILTYDINNRCTMTVKELRALLFPLHVARFLGGEDVKTLPVYRFAGACRLQGRLPRIQGGCFSEDGCLYLTSDEGKTSGSSARPGVLRFSMLNGALLDSIGINREDDPEAGATDWSAQEVEGICLSPTNLFPLKKPKLSKRYTEPRYLCTGVWQKEVGYGDDVVYFKYREVPPRRFW